MPFPSYHLTCRASLMLFWAIGGGIASFLENGLDCHPVVIPKLALTAFASLSVFCGNSSSFKHRRFCTWLPPFPIVVASFLSQMRCALEHFMKSPVSQLWKAHYCEFKVISFLYVHCALISLQEPPETHRTHGRGMGLGGSGWVSHVERVYDFSGVPVREHICVPCLQKVHSPSASIPWGIKEVA